jgi:N-acetylglucosamine malate deacetylase 1
MNSYRDFIVKYAALLEEASAISLLSSSDEQEQKPVGPCVFIFSPHPDDECIVGALPLRLSKQANMRVINIAVTLGSNRARRAERAYELKQACRVAGFDLIIPENFQDVTVATREHNKQAWSCMVKDIINLIELYKPRMLLVPHGDDWHSTHIGTYYLVMDALKLLNPLDCYIIQTEYWRPMADPNLLVESSINEVAQLVQALACHRGEVARNPYHISLPAWMHDTVRRGSEVVGGMGGSSAGFYFGTLYKAALWRNASLEKMWQKGAIIRSHENVLATLKLN